MESSYIYLWEIAAEVGRCLVEDVSILNESFGQKGIRFGRNLRMEMEMEIVD
jgi:hypothetical protein